MGKLLDLFRGITGKKKKQKIMDILEEEKAPETQPIQPLEWMEMKTTADALKKIGSGIPDPGVKTQEATSAIQKLIRAMAESISVYDRQSTNNWRKMHGLPMRRMNSDRRRKK